MKKVKRYTVASCVLATALVMTSPALAEESTLVETPIESEEEVEVVEEEVEETVEEDSEPESTKPLYTDVPSDHFASASISYLSELDIISGTEEGRFNPDQPVNRAQAAKMLANALNLTEPNQYKLKANDIPADHWAIGHFKALEKAGIMTGSNEKLKPQANVTRAQMAKMLNAAFDYASPTKFHSFNDVSRSFWAFKDINILASNGITTQVNTDFRPNDQLTRAQFTLFLARSLDDRFKIQ